MKLISGLFLFFLFSCSLAPKALAEGQYPADRRDSLRGSLSPLRTCYDVKYYHLDVKLDISRKFLSGSTDISFVATRDFSALQVDLFANMQVDKIVFADKSLKYTREHDAIFVNFPSTIARGQRRSFKVFFSGYPTEAKHAPWDGGFTFAKDSVGKPWVSTSVQGIGASLWWPNKDHQSDEPDSMLISVSVPKGLMDISNGRLRKVTPVSNNYVKYDWFVANPINNYSVSLNVGDYVAINDSYEGERGKLDLQYWVLKDHAKTARPHFEKNVKPMLRSFESWFGPYPFYEDGYKLVETPYLGMEHQSNIAYGNLFMNGYRGRDLSGTGWGSKWDFIIIHESGHEWFGNNITSNDLADMWVHESFTNYSESLYVESLFGKQAGQEYVHGLRGAILNDRPVIGPRGINKEGSGDMYYKGANLLNMIRTIINDDEKWKSILRGLNKTFYHKTVDGADVVNFINTAAGMDFTPVFDQYLNYKNIPTLEIITRNGRLHARWIADADHFNMPVRLRKKGGDYRFYTVGSQLQDLDLPGVGSADIEVDTFNYYIGVLIE